MLCPATLLSTHLRKSFFELTQNVEHFRPNRILHIGILFALFVLPQAFAASSDILGIAKQSSGRIDTTSQTQEDPAITIPTTKSHENEMSNPMDSNPQNSAEQLDKVCIIGSGNWGSAIATKVGLNCERLATNISGICHCHARLERRQYEACPERVFR